MSAHTPGPWKVEGKFVLVGRRLLAAAQAPRQYPDPMDEMQGDESWLDAYARLKPARDAILAEQHSNARLIALAPKMLDTLRAISALHDSRCDEGPSIALEIVREFEEGA